MLIYGHYNRSKAKALLVLYDKRINLNDNEGIGIKKLSLLSKVSYWSIACRVRTWARWHYLKERTGSNGRYVYSILQKGIDFVTAIPPNQLEELLNEMRGKE